MKKLSVFLACALAFTACNKEDNPSGNNNNSYYLTAKVDGTDFAADMSSSVTIASKPHTGFLSITGAKTDATTGVFLINLSSYNGAGTYTVGTGGGNSYARYTTGTVANNTYSSWNADNTSNTTGSVIVASDNGGVVEGTFSFEGYSEEAKNKKTITEGKFRMKLQ